MRGLITPLTQSTTRDLARLATSVRGLRAGSRLRRGKPVDDRGAALVDLNLRDERADDVTPFEPGDGVESLPHARREVLELRDDRAQMDRLAKLSICIDDLALRLVDSRAHGLAAHLELFEFYRADFVCINEAFKPRS